MKKTKENGITIIALVITIIVLIILAAVVINLALNNGGLINKVQQATSQYKEQAAYEKVSLSVLSYQAGDGSTALYDELSTIVGLESIDPAEANATEYTLIVDGYEFVVKYNDGNITIESIGIANGNIPEIISLTQENIDSGTVKISITTKIEDDAGIKELTLLLNNTIIETKNVSGKNVQEEFTITSNGTYKIQVKGENKRKVLSDDIEVTSIEVLSGNVTASAINQGKVNITVTASTREGTVNKIELYEYNDGENKSTARKIGEDIVNGIEVEKTYSNIQLEFYKGKNYYAVLNGEKETPVLTGVKNVNSIYTATDLVNLRNEVNRTNGSHFETNTITQYADITVSNWIPIGYGTIIHDTNWGEKYFSGIYNGNNHTIQVNGISSTLPSDLLFGVGVFGHIRDGRVMNLKVNGTISGPSFVAGVVGCIIKNNNNNYVSIYNCENRASISDSDFGAAGIVACTKNADVANCINTGNEGTIGSNAMRAGGIVSFAQSCSINNCTNTKNIISTTALETSYVAGIVGDAYTNVSVSNCYNTGNVSGGRYVGGIVGFLNNNGTINKCCNIGYIKQTKSGLCDAGGIVGGIMNGTFTMSNCYNGAWVYGPETKGGLVGLVWGYEANTVMTISKSLSYRGGTGNSGINAALVGSVGREGSYTCYLTLNHTYTTENVGTYGVGFKYANNVVTANHYSGYIESAAAWTNKNTSSDQSMVYWLNGESSSGEFTIDNSTNNPISYGYPYLRDFVVPATWTDQAVTGF